MEFLRKNTHLIHLTVFRLRLAMRSIFEIISMMQSQLFFGSDFIPIQYVISIFKNIFYEAVDYYP